MACGGVSGIPDAYAVWGCSIIPSSWAGSGDEGALFVWEVDIETLVSVSCMFHVSLIGRQDSYFTEDRMLCRSTRYW